MDYCDGVLRYCLLEVGGVRVVREWILQGRGSELKKIEQVVSFRNELPYPTVNLKKMHELLHHLHFSKSDIIFLHLRRSNNPLFSDSAPACIVPPSRKEFLKNRLVRSYAYHHIKVVTIHNNIILCFSSVFDEKIFRWAIHRLFFAYKNNTNSILFFLFKTTILRKNKEVRCVLTFRY